MNQGQQHHLHQCYADYTKALGTCDRCDPPKEPILKRWIDAVHSVGDYLNVLIDNVNLDATTDPERARVVVTKHPVSDIFAWKTGNPWEAGVFEADSFDSGTPSWYWRIPGESSSSAHHTSDPATAIIECVNAYEDALGADPLAPRLVFTVRLQSCEGGHDWKYLYTGRHGSDKGDNFYACQVLGCGAEKVE